MTAGHSEEGRSPWGGVQTCPRTPPVKVLIVDRQRTFADALAARLAMEPDITVVTAVHSAESAQRLIVGRRVGVILLDADFPNGAALALSAEASASEHAPRIVMLSASAEPERIVAAVRAGALAWVRKDESMEHLLRVISGVSCGESWVPPAALGRMLRLLLAGQGKHAGDDPLAALTPRERQVLFHMTQGAGRQEVAERLHLSANTVRTHMQSLMAKLGVHSALEAVALSRSRLDALTSEWQ